MPANQFAYVTTQADLARAIASRVLAASEVLNAAAGMQAKLLGIKKRVRITARRWGLAEDARAVAGGYVGRATDAG